ncbi:peptidase M24 [Luteitalea sp. TBR-22]|uniref:M23 family metallopeptidase n=1 Tax=Luteitalea sp. TBR-22 TaxID=2802971 RepID=UPI001AF97F6D|nr:M23 family metallopeptidase [Luteitalea sp. TBR-22]BCS31266.1 peptidase M24 [Luteitalea sp. TBR-22]
MTTRSFSFALTVAVLTAGCSQQPAPQASATALAAVQVHEQATRLIEARVPRNATLASLLRAHQVSDDIVNHFVETAKKRFDLRRLRADRPYRLQVGLDGAIREFTYQIDADKFLKVVGGDEKAAPDALPEYDVQVVPYEKHKALMSIRGEISRETPSLIGAVNAAGESIGLALEFAKIFEGEVDFGNELQPGDSFEILFEKVVREGEFGGYGDILAARFTTGGRSFEAFRYEIPGQKADYYDRDGRSMRRFFLKTPLKFEPRVTSGFSFRRVHPVLKTARAHRGVDYGAPSGAPVLSVASGTVVRAGWTGGGGNSVYIKHDNGYETRYLHFSRIAPGLRAGMRVSQGELIGYVGSTGLSTGPHLHYELLKGGVHVNPLDEHRKLPPGQPIPAGALAAYIAHRDRQAYRFAGSPDRPLGRLAQAVVPTSKPAAATGN